MTQDERKEVVKTLVAMSELYGRELSHASVKLMADQLMDLDGHATLSALKRYMQDPAAKTFPLPGIIRGMVLPQPMNDDQMAIEIATRIQQSRGRFGCGVYVEGADYDRLKARVRAFVGEVGWAIIELEGGWTNLCSRAETNATSERAQLRDLAKALIVKAKSGDLNAPPELPESSKQKQLGHAPVKAGGPMAIGELINRPQEGAQNAERNDIRSDNAGRGTDPERGN